MQKLNYARLRYFYRVASLGSQAEAARQMRVSQSTISEQIKLLEAELRTKLFTRKSASLALTESGRKALEHAEVIFGAGERLLRDLDVALTPRTVIEVGVAATVSRTLAAELFLPLLHDEEMCPRISIADVGALVPRLSSGELHVLVSDLEPKGPSASRITSVATRHTNFVVVATPEGAEGISDIGDLHAKPWVHFTTSSGFRWAVDSFMRNNHVTPETVAETDDLELMRRAVLEGVGIAALPESFVAEQLEAGEVVALSHLTDPVPLFVSHVDDDVSDLVGRAVEVLTRGDD